MQQQVGAHEELDLRTPPLILGVPGRGVWDSLRIQEPDLAVLIGAFQGEPDQVRVAINGFDLYQQGSPLTFDVAQVSASIADNVDTSIVVELKSGTAAARFWTSDLTADYVRFNSEFHT